ncbi:TIGR02444 family protein [Haliea sp. E1-2-M8]|uniref:TIGR02444 family protein n=1 Tax=Haliea sp. E1-2-M8 TaxID=3064706 RepID=UPI00271C2A50|nr:TIGR02444 family protein [Haliea sp. E1-2-M8]MDO8861779.1 TIGR02444 family protein [Haliea sp. E1-2-M8]
MNNPLWEFSLALYARSGVAVACIEAQDCCAADVNLLLYAAWLARQGLELDQNQWRALAASVAEWRQRVVQPLRALRRDWRALPAAAALREQVKVLELAAEQSQQAQILAWHRQQVLQPARADSLPRALAFLLGSAPMQDTGEQRLLLQRLLTLLK